MVVVDMRIRLSIRRIVAQIAQDQLALLTMILILICGWLHSIGWCWGVFLRRLLLCF